SPTAPCRSIKRWAWQPDPADLWRWRGSHFLARLSIERHVPGEVSSPWETTVEVLSLDHGLSPASLLI
ncbi:MAG: hypothetical protein WAU27_18550, partial [Pseudomonadales bacterium]